VFWLLSLLMPSLRRDTGNKPFDNLSTLLSSPQSRGILFKLVAMLLGAALVWFIIAAILSLFNAWFIVLLAMVLGAVVSVQEWRKRRREEWIQTGRCANCGYDLRATPDRCPECGRDVLLDEPIWKRMRRELEAKLLAQAETVEDATLQPVGVPASPSAEIDQTPKPKVVIKAPVVDDGPIPLEGDES
jgi:hypothetical protein